ncbi:hypothetical protein CYMTET_50376 [Cymbomonas tetramitiformis]|uniref:Uncharacterized protein n=1 Tax=Cymbomonas tetramitiformis TaxID=36881 RepID=A0AAE0BNB8_9CHLO|nr:hypothetical protein CYMTET_50376 [Cymbomonas tetramitiformis]
MVGQAVTIIDGELVVERANVDTDQFLPEDDSPIDFQGYHSEFRKNLEDALSVVAEGNKNCKKIEKLKKLTEDIQDGTVRPVLKGTSMEQYEQWMAQRKSVRQQQACSVTAQKNASIEAESCSTRESSPKDTSAVSSAPRSEVSLLQCFRDLQNLLPELDEDDKEQIQLEHAKAHAKTKERWMSQGIDVDLILPKEATEVSVEKEDEKPLGSPGCDLVTSSASAGSNSEKPMNMPASVGSLNMQLQGQSGAADAKAVAEKDAPHKILAKTSGVDAYGEHELANEWDRMVWGVDYLDENDESELQRWEDSMTDMVMSQFNSERAGWLGFQQQSAEARDTKKGKKSRKKEQKKLCQDASSEEKFQLRDPVPALAPSDVLLSHVNDLSNYDPEQLD